MLSRDPYILFQSFKPNFSFLRNFWISFRDVEILTSVSEEEILIDILALLQVCFKINWKLLVQELSFLSNK